MTMYSLSQTFVITEFSLRYSNSAIGKAFTFGKQYVESKCLVGKNAKIVARWSITQLCWYLNMPDFVELVTSWLDLSYP